MVGTSSRDIDLQTVMLTVDA